MPSVYAPDGVQISYSQRGTGAPVLLVHGTSADSSFWVPVVSRLQRTHRVLNMDRRGRGDSGDAAEYAIENEFADIAAIVDSVDQPVVIVGHSFGALCALEATALTNRIKQLILYEAPLPGSFPDWPGPLRDGMKAPLQAGRPEDAFIAFLRLLHRISPPDIEAMQALPTWPAKIRQAHTIFREIESLVNYELKLDRLARLTLPITVVNGAQSTPQTTAITGVLKAVVPHLQTAILAGQGHFAVRRAPDKFVEAVRSAMI